MIFSIEPEIALIDKRVKILISGLDPNIEVEIKAFCNDKDGNMWRSSATFISDQNGTIDLAKQAPKNGSYNGIDEMGLFWSMHPMKDGVSCFSYDKDVMEITFSLFIDNKKVEEKVIRRLFISSDVIREDVRENGLVGKLFYSSNCEKNRSAIIVLSGSNGGIPYEYSKILASSGYLVFALGYFGVDKLPDRLENISMEYFKKAIDWIKTHPKVDEKVKIGIIGSSRGGELVLLLASTFPKDINAVVARVPSSIIYGGYPDDNKAAWTFQGNPLGPYFPGFIGDREKVANLMKKNKIPTHVGSFDDPLESTPLFLYEMKENVDAVKVASIAVEKIEAPLLIISGEDDKMWPSSLFGDFVMKRLTEKNSPISRFHMSFSNAGHVIKFPYIPSGAHPYYHPVGKVWFYAGGTLEGNAYANKESWEKTLSFLKEAFV